nr:GTPase HflX [Micavibrio sp.]
SDSFDAQHDDVIKILDELGIEYDSDERIMEVYNKIDVLDADALSDIIRKERHSNRVVAVSALSGQGLDVLLEKIEQKIASEYTSARFDLSHADGRALAWLHEHGEVLERESGEDAMQVNTRLSIANMARFCDKFGYEPR